MNRFEFLVPAGDRIGFGVVVLIAALVRIYDIDGASLWLDEVSTLTKAQLPLSTLWVSAYDPTPPLHYSLIHVLSALFTPDEMLLRLPSVTFGTMTVMVVYIIARNVAGSIAGLGASMVMALSFHNLEYSQEARAYALLGLCIAISFLGIVYLQGRWKEDVNGFTLATFLRAGGGLFALGLLGALYTHNVAVFYWLGVQCFFVAWWIRPFRGALNCLAHWAAMNLVVLILWLPWLLVVDGTVFSWLKQPAPIDALQTFAAVHGMPPVQTTRPLLFPLLVLLALIGIYSLRQNKPMLFALVGLLLASSVLIWFYGLIDRPIYMRRTILWGSMFSAVAIGVGVSRLPQRAGYVALALIFAGSSLDAVDYFRGGFAQNGDWRSAAHAFVNEKLSHDLLLIRPGYTVNAAILYLPKEMAGQELLSQDCEAERPTYLMRIESVSPIPRASLIRRFQMPPDAETGGRIWVVDSHCGTSQQNANPPYGLEGWRIQLTHRFKGVRLVILERNRT